jgi:hypothetical protein
MEGFFFSVGSVARETNCQILHRWILKGHSTTHPFSACILHATLTEVCLVVSVAKEILHGECAEAEPECERYVRTLRSDSVRNGL